LTGTGSFHESSNDQAAIYNGSTTGSPPISVTTHCETYIDGAMKVTMTLGTGSVNSMYLEIPVKDAMAPLFHAIHGSQDIRHNPAYALPPGNGDVWNSTM